MDRFVSKKDKASVQCDYISRLFPKCRTITTLNQEGRYAVRITEQYFRELLGMIDVMNQFEVTCVKVINAQYHR